MTTLSLDQHRRVCNSSSEHSRARFYPLSTRYVTRYHSFHDAGPCVYPTAEFASPIANCSSPVTPVSPVLPFRNFARHRTIFSFAQHLVEQHWDFRTLFNLTLLSCVTILSRTLSLSLVGGISRWLRRIVVSTESTNTCRSMCRHLIIRSRRKRQLSPSFFDGRHASLLSALSPALGRKLVVAVIACGTLSGNVPREGKMDRRLQDSIFSRAIFYFWAWNLKLCVHRL